MFFFFKQEIIQLKTFYFIFSIYFYYLLDVYHFDNNTTTGTSVLDTDSDLSANNNDYQITILPVLFCISLALFILSVIFFNMTFVMN